MQIPFYSYDNFYEHFLLIVIMSFMAYLSYDEKNLAATLRFIQKHFTLS